MSLLSRDDARRLFGDDLIDHEALGALLGANAPDATPEIPFERQVAESARASGCLLLYRPAALRDGRRLTLATLAEIGSGREDGLAAFSAEDPWFVHDPTVNLEAAEEGWALVSPEPWAETLNQTYSQGEEALRSRAGSAPWRRRRAAEIALDTLAYASARGRRVLVDRWDWSSTPSLDGGLLNLGGFREAGLDVLSYSRAVKHGALGICPTLVARG